MTGDENQEYDRDSLPDLLPIYYKRLFPYGPYYKWLNYGGVPKTYFTHREFSFTLKDDVYIRYQSFADQQEMEKEIQKKCPYKIDIGAVFTHKPKEHKTVKAAAFQAQEKELVFDIDMTDYDDVRNCCSGADICLKCWPLMVIAVKIIDRALRDDFGFDHLLWVYSGRRGIHCWVCDEAARKLSQSARSAVAEYLSVVKGGENQLKKVTLDDYNFHPSIQHAIEIAEEYFPNYAGTQQEFMETEERMTAVLSLIKDTELQQEIRRSIGKVNAMKSEDRFKVLKAIASKWDQSKNKKVQRSGEEIMLQYCYPRLDINVSKGVNHLLKSPFCIHPKTGRVCVPMDPNTIETFDPFKVPTISQLCDEINKLEQNEEAKKLKDYKRTSLKGYMEYFDRFLKSLESTWKGKLIEESDKSISF